MSPFESDPTRLVVEGLDDVYIAIDAMQYVAGTAAPSYAMMLAKTTEELEDFKLLFELANAHGTGAVEASAQLSPLASIDVIAALALAATSPNPVLAMLADDAYKEFAEQL